MQNNFETVNVLGLDFIKATQTEFLEQLKRDSQTKANRFIVTANPEIVLAAKDDLAYAKTIRSADYVTADGIGIIKGAKILGEIVGYGSNCDAFHMTAPDPTGEGAAMAMQLALDEAKLKPAQVDYINAHGTATKANDAAEAKAINLVFGEDSRVLVGSTKAMTGHLLGAAGAIEAIAVVASLQKGRSPVNIGMTEQDKECKVNVVTQAKAHPEKLEYALSNSLGFGGHNAVLAFRKWS